MKDFFYTMGGSQFWEDVFFYQKWRIQRNCTTKNYRLLDNWDICRKMGDFETCRKTFLKYIESYEISRQKGHMIIMIHGLGQSKNFFKPLWREALKHSFMAAAINYPSTQNDLQAILNQFHFLLNHLEDVTDLSFVTHGCGNIILHKLFEKKEDWQKRFSFHQVVEANPYLKKNRLLEKMCKSRLLSFIFGPLANDLTDENLIKISPLAEMHTAIVLTKKPWYKRLIEFLLGASQPDISLNEAEKITKDIIRVKPKRSNLFKDSAVCSRIIKFLEKGTF